MMKRSVIVFLALLLMSIGAMPVLAQQGGGGAGGKGFVGGHPEGPDPIAGEICVDLDGDGSLDVCDTIDGHGSIFVDIPGPFVDGATFTARIGPSLGDLIVGTDQLTGAACKDMPVDGSGMALCQDSRSDITKRFNINWNANSANGGGKGGREGDDPDR